MAEREVTLREITAETVWAICKLDVHPDQREFVAPNAFSIAEAYFEPKMWLRAVYAGDDPVGFAMLYADTEKPEYFLWRFMIAAEHQGNGYGRRALDLVVEHVRGLPGARELLTSFDLGERGPRGFYLQHGFVETGEIDDGEHVVRLEL